jgi:hypothetical protein
MPIAIKLRNVNMNVHERRSGICRWIFHVKNFQLRSTTPTPLPSVMRSSGPTVSTSTNPTFAPTFSPTLVPTYKSSTSTPLPTNNRHFQLSLFHQLCSKYEVGEPTFSPCTTMPTKETIEIFKPRSTRLNGTGDESSTFILIKWQFLEEFPWEQCLGRIRYLRLITALLFISVVIMTQLWTTFMVIDMDILTFLLADGYKASVTEWLHRSIELPCGMMNRRTIIILSNI